MLELKKQKPVEVFCDGSLHGKYGGYGIVMIFGEKVKEIESKAYFETTIARMEMKAIIDSLETISVGYGIYLYCDNKNIVDAINRTLSRWIETGTLQNKQNHDLWVRFLQAKRKHIEGGSYMQFCWLRGHAGNKFNERADKLAKRAMIGGGKVKCLKNN